MLIEATKGQQLVLPFRSIFSFQFCENHKTEDNDAETNTEGTRWPSVPLSR